MLGNKCVRCKVRNKRLLHIDHVKPVHLSGKPRENSSVFYAAVLNGKCTDELQLLCANCHLLKTKDDALVSDEGRWGLYVESLGGVVSEDVVIDRPTRAYKKKNSFDATGLVKIPQYYKYKGEKCRWIYVPEDESRKGVPTIESNNAMMTNELVEANVR